jgi:hypothetical protein
MCKHNNRKNNLAEYCITVYLRIADVLRNLRIVRKMIRKISDAGRALIPYRLAPFQHALYAFKGFLFTAKLQKGFSFQIE